MRGIKLIALFAALAIGAPGLGLAGICPKKITTTIPFLNLPCPSGDPRWGQAFGHWEKRADKDEVVAAYDIFVAIQAQNQDSVEANLWLMRSSYAMGLKQRDEDQIKYMKVCRAIADRVLAKDPDNIYAKYWGWASMIYFHDFTDKDFAEIRAFGQNYAHLRELPVPDDDPMWAEAIAHWDARYAYEEGKKAIAVFEKLEKKYPRRIEPKMWLLRSNYWMHYPEKGEDGKARWCKIAADWGEKAIAMEPRNPAANYLTAAALGQYGSNTSFINMVRYAPSITMKLMVVMEEDPNYFYGGVSQYFCLAIARTGALVSKSIELIGISAELIEKNAIFAANYEPRYLRNYYALGEMYLRQGKKAEAKKMLEKTVGADPAELKNMEPENRVAQELARKLLKENF